MQAAINYAIISLLHLLVMQEDHLDEHLVALSGALRAYARMHFPPSLQKDLPKGDGV
jgi:hypothetical protein